MAKVMINKEILEHFNDTIQDIQFNLRIELNKDTLDKQNIYKLMGFLVSSWNDVYNPIDYDRKRNIRNVYSQYISAQKRGDIQLSSHLLSLYKELRDSLSQ